MSIIYSVTIFIILLIIMVTNLIKCNKKCYYNIITNLKLISIFSLVFGCLNFFFSFVLECYYQLQEFPTLYQAKIFKNTIVINGLKNGIISPILGMVYFFCGSFLIKKIKQKKRLQFIKVKNYV